MARSSEPPTSLRSVPTEEPVRGRTAGSAAGNEVTLKAFGALLRHWRTRRGLSQLALALQAEVSARHLSWLETGKAEPSRAMVLRLAEQLDLPLRERNALLAAAGYAALYAVRPLSDPAMGPVRVALQRLLDAHEPWPALAVDRHWQLLAHNRLVPLLLAQAAPELTVPPVNVLRLSLHPKGLAPLIDNLGAWRAYVLHRLQAQVASTQDRELQALLDELRALPGPAAPSSRGANKDTATEPELLDVAVPLALRTPVGVLRFITAVTVFGAPNDVTLAEIAIETLLPADAETAESLRQLVQQLPPAPVQAHVQALDDAPAGTAATT